MKNRICVAMIFALTNVAFGLSCQEEMVGAPCRSEIDKGAYSQDLGGTTWSVETRSVQCETRTCVTQTKLISSAPSVQTKYSFCSCRCKDLEGHTFDANSDKYDDMCECPPNTICEQIVALPEAPDKVNGFYCIPSVISSGCDDPTEVCTPASDSATPWEWSCKKREDDAQVGQ